MRKKRKTPEEVRELAPKIVEYYFDNPHANGYKYIRDKFDITDHTIRRIISDELDNRFKKRHSNICIKELED